MTIDALFDLHLPIAVPPKPAQVNCSEPAFKGNLQADFKSFGRNAPENAP